MDPLKLYKYNIMFLLFILEIIGYASVKSFNPLKFFNTNSLFIKVVIVIIIIIILLQIIILRALKGIDVDADCSDPECGRSIRTFLLVYNGAFQCPRCGRWYHRTCWERLNKNSIYEAARNQQGCKLCNEELGGKPRLFKEDDIFGGRF